MKASTDPVAAQYIGYYTPAEIEYHTSNTPQNQMPSLPGERDILHIHHIKRHWVTTFYCASSRTVFVCDSLRNKSHFDLVMKQINVVYGVLAVNVKQVNVTQQNSNPDCGPMAIAFANSYFLKSDPSKRKFDVSKARQHLKMCITNGCITQFPTFTDSWKGYNVLEEGEHNGHREQVDSQTKGDKQIEEHMQPVDLTHANSNMQKTIHSAENKTRYNLKRRKVQDNDFSCPNKITKSDIGAEHNYKNVHETLLHRYFTDQSFRLEEKSRENCTNSDKQLLTKKTKTKLRKEKDKLRKRRIRENKSDIQRDLDKEKDNFRKQFARQLKHKQHEMSNDKTSKKHEKHSKTTEQKKACSLKETVPKRLERRLKNTEQKQLETARNTARMKLERQKKTTKQKQLETARNTARMRLKRQNKTNKQKQFETAKNTTIKKT